MVLIIELFSAILLWAYQSFSTYFVCGGGWLVLKELITSVFDLNVCNLRNHFIYTFLVGGACISFRGHMDEGEKIYSFWV